jgi:hypothetical protein
MAGWVEGSKAQISLLFLEDGCELLGLREIERKGWHQ